MRTFFSVLLSVCIVSPLFLYADGASKDVKNGTSCVRVTKATGIVSQGDTSYIFKLTWSSTRIPTSFFWRGSDGWMVCRVLAENGAPTQDITADISPDQVKKGNRIQVVPVSGGRYAIPRGVTSSMKRTLFFTTGANQWYAVPVKNIVYKK